jgi:uncharacterized oxidoreductase
MLIAQDTLTRFTAEIFITAGAPDAHAHTVAEHLVEANLKGHDSHGVGMIPHYIHNLQQESMSPGAEIEVVKDNGAVLLVDGNRGFGQVVGRQATALALERVRETGIVCLGLRNAHHLGRIGGYGEQCGNAGFISLHFVNVVGHPPQVSPWAGRERRLGTNPFCCVVPRPGDTPVVLDMATSAIAQGKVRVAHMKGEPVPDGALVDAEGVPTNDPGVMFSDPAGALGPFGAHKGYGLALMCELLGGALAGEWGRPAIRGANDTIINHMLMFVLDPEAFGNRSAFESELRDVIEYMHSTTAAKGHDRVRIPGEPELESLAERSANGIPVDDNSWSAILRTADRAGLSPERVGELTGSNPA